MDLGWMFQGMVCVGDRITLYSAPTGGRTQMVVVGCGQRADGTGFRITPGAGLLSTTEDGVPQRASAGCGCPIPRGDLPGFVGGEPQVIAGGLPCPRVRIGEGAVGIMTTTLWDSILRSVWDTQNSFFFRGEDFVNIAPITFIRHVGTRKGSTEFPRWQM